MTSEGARVFTILLVFLWTLNSSAGQLFLQLQKPNSGYKLERTSIPKYIGHQEWYRRSKIMKGVHKVTTCQHGYLNTIQSNFCCKILQKILLPFLFFQTQLVLPSSIFKDSQSQINYTGSSHWTFHDINILYQYWIPHFEREFSTSISRKTSNSLSQLTEVVHPIIHLYHCAHMPNTVIFVVFSK